MTDIPPHIIQRAEGLWSGSGPVEATPLTPDASDRSYFRLTREGQGEGRILMAGPDRGENLKWLLFGRQLWLEGLPLPRIHAADMDLGLFLMEDLGDARLERAVLDKLLDSGERLSLYTEAVGLLADFHERALPALSRLQAHFNEEYSRGFAFACEYRYFAAAAEQLGLLAIELRKVRKEASDLAGEAAGSEDRVFIHRDLQSRNIMIKDGGMRLIDWQGGRIGPSSYDLASLLYDPYVPMEWDLREELVERYISQRRTLSDPGAFKRNFWLTATLRLMQAFGAYCNITWIKKRPGYHSYLLPALTRIDGLMHSPHLGRFPNLAASVRKILEMYHAKGLDQDPALDRDWVKAQRIANARPAGRPKAAPEPEPKARPAGRPKAKKAGRPKARPVGRPKTKTAGRPKARPAGRPKAKKPGRPKTRTVGRPKTKTAARPKARPVGRPKTKKVGRPKTKTAARPKAKTLGRPKARPKFQPGPLPGPRPSPRPSPHAKGGRPSEEAHRPGGAAQRGEVLPLQQAPEGLQGPGGRHARGHQGQALRRLRHRRQGGDPRRHRGLRHVQGG
jgi:aminoglycoside/choline kinase family phosphotransferase